MKLQKTFLEHLSSENILDFISDYETKYVPHLDDLWEYYKGKNVKILSRKKPDMNNPDNKIVVSYARKIVNTFTGYGYRPKYISYKPNIKKTTEQIEQDEIKANKIIEDPIEKKYVNELQNVYNANNETIKTNRAGRNTAIFGLSYELLYIDSEVQPINEELPIRAIPKFFTVDPREMILLYDYSPEPKIKMGIRYYKITNNEYKVEVYYKDHTEFYIRYREETNGTLNEWKLKPDTISKAKNYYDGVPIVAYYLGDEKQSLFENVLELIDAYDVLFSDSMNEFDRFAFAYMIMKKFGLTDVNNKKDPVKANAAIQDLKRRRVFEHLSADAEIKFLTKDIPTDFIKYMGEIIREQIHIQSHVPDFTGDKMAGASGIAIQRLMFDFENLVASAEADFDVGLMERIRLITSILKRLNLPVGTIDMVTISHKRNIPLNIQEFAQTANIMNQAGFSRRAIVGIMPEDIIPDVEEELKEEQEEQGNMAQNDLTNNSYGEPNDVEKKAIQDLIDNGMSEEDAYNKIMEEI